LVGLLLIALAAAVLAWRAADGPSGEPAVLPHDVVAAAGNDRLIVEPDDGMQPIDALLASPQHSLDLCIYELADPTVEGILATDAQRGVTVRVLLDHHLEAVQNAPAAAFLRSRDVTVRWASDRFFVTHEKAFVVDHRTAVVMSLNLASRYYASTRDAAVVDSDPSDVRAIEDVFGADFDGRSVQAPSGDDLVWSPDRSRADLLALIDSARHSILIESEELEAPAVVEALIEAARRGVAVGVAMTDQAQWEQSFSALTRAGGRVSVLHGESPLYIHAKLLVVDAGRPGARALVGSQNLSDTSLDEDRELGVVLTAPPLVSTIGRLVEHDMSLGTAWP
jgi:phosphatidylserine/phosphatidylglycerophosphate/cardiolipin synthase-like enzyme